MKLKKLVVFIVWIQAAFSGPRFIVFPASTEPEKLYREVHQAVNDDIVVLAKGTPSLEKLKKVYQNPNVWMSVSEDVSFYAGLFKQISLEDVFAGRMMTSLVELAGYHMTGDIKKVSRKHPYEPAKGLKQKALKNKKADLVVFSFNRPLQLYAFLESTEKYVKGLGDIYVIYRTSKEDYQEGYNKVQRRFRGVKFLQQGQNPAQDFKPLFLRAAFQNLSSYVLFAVDDIIVKNKVDLEKCVELMEKTQAFGTFLRLGSHIDYCYMQDARQKIPRSWEIEKGVFAWRFKEGEHDWRYPCSVDMSLYKKSEIEEVLKKIEYHNPNLLESKWALKAKYHKIGLYFEEAKIVNIPLNMVNQSNLWGNRQMQSYTPQELLKKFQEGLKIDIRPFSLRQDRSVHIDAEITFINRNE